MRFLLTTDPGIETIVADEVADARPDAAIRPDPYASGGLVLVELASPAPELFELATVHHVLELRHDAPAATLDDIRAAAREVALPELEHAASFRVTTERRGQHDFSTIDVQRAAGAVLHERFGTPVDLEQPALEIRVDLHGDHVAIGLRRTSRPLDARIRRSRPLRSALKPTLAAALIRLAGAHRGGGRLIDPMCGAATIPLEARRINPGLEVQAADWDEETVAVARESASEHGVDLDVEVADARALGELHPGRFDYIVTDPPYGVRQARRTSMTRLYGALLASFERALAAGGTIALIAVKERTFLAALEGTSLRVVDRREVDLGSMRAVLLVLRRHSAATEHSSVGTPEG